ncbi:MAG: ribosome silencing factor [Lentisphaeria bacterium]
MPEASNATIEGKELARKIADICAERKAEDIVVYDVTGMSLLTDYYLICTGNAEPHLTGIANQLQKQLGDAGLRPDRVDGAASSKWIVMDYGTVLVHIFHRDLRRYYELEKLFDDDRLIIGEKPETITGT